MATFTSKFFDSHTKREITNPQELDAHETFAQSVCDEDGSRVSIEAVGTSELAHCQRRHRWQNNFQGAWIALK